MECLFCKIIAKEIPSALIYENNEVLAFLDVHPRAPGHLLVIPKEHAPTLAALNPERVPGLFLATQYLATALAKALEVAGLTIGINQGKVSGQSVDHLHIHLLPRFEGDGGGSIHSVVNNPPQLTLEEVAHKIKTQL